MIQQPLSNDSNRWAFALDASEIGVWELDLTTQSAWRSLLHDQIFGYPELLPEWTYQLFIDHVLEADRGAVEAAFERALETRGEWRFECRIRRADGEERWLAAKGRVHVDASAQPAAMFGTVQDVTERKRVEQAALESEARFRIAIKNAAVVAAQMDRDSRYQWIYNPHPDFDPCWVLGKRDDELEDSEGARQLVALKRRVLESGEGERQSIRFDRSDGLRIYDSFIEPLHDAVGNIIGLTSSSFDVTERVLAEEALAAANAELLEGSRRKDDFLATLAHELRNPLAPIQSGLDILRLTSPGVPEVQRVLPMMERQMDQLKRLVDDLLDISRITRDKISLIRQPVDLRQVVEDAFETAAAQARRRMSLDLPGEPAVVVGDEVRLRQVIGNVLDNAVKFTPEEVGNIWVSLRRHDGVAVIGIRDDGRGIAPELQSRVFDAFEQDESSEGLGIGLALAHRLVEMHEGHIEVSSKGRGHGSEFTIFLPIHADRESVPSAATL